MKITKSPVLVTTPVEQLRPMEIGDMWESKHGYTTLLVTFDRKMEAGEDHRCHRLYLTREEAAKLAHELRMLVVS